jgi:hypothetical protein
MLAEEQFESEDQRKERQAALKAQTEERRRKLAAVVGRSALNVKIQVFLVKNCFFDNFSSDIWTLRNYLGNTFSSNSIT